MSEHPDKAILIKAAARELFTRYGYSKTSLDDIAKAAHIGKGTIYYYFATKEDIFVETIHDHSEIFLEYLQAQVDQETTLEGKLTVYFRTPGASDQGAFFGY